MKKMVIALLLGTSLTTFANDIDDMDYIYKLYQNKMNKEAILELNKFVNRYSNSKLYDSALNLLGYNYYIVGDYKKSEEIFLQLLNTNYKEEAYYYLMNIYIKWDNKELATFYYEKIHNDSKLKSKSMFLMGNFMYSLGSLKEAETYYSRAIKYSDKYYNNSLLNLGLTYFGEKEYIKTAAVLEEYISEVRIKDDNLAKAYFFLGLANEKLKDYESAIKYYKNIELEFRNSEYYVQSIYSLEKLSYALDKDTEILIYAKKLENTKLEKDGLILLSEMYYNSKKYKESAKYYNKIFQKYKDIGAGYKLILSYLKLKDYDNALININILKNTKYNNEYYYYSIYIYYNKKEYKEILNLEKEIKKEEYKINKDYKKDIFNMIAEAAYNLKNYEMAKQYYAKLNTPNAIYRLITIAYIQEDVEEMETLFEDYKKNYDKDITKKLDIYSLMGNLYAEQSENKKAEILYKEFLKKEKNEIIINNLITVLFDERKYEQALIYIKDIKNENKKSWLNAVTFMALHNYKPAAIELKKLILKDNKYTKRAYLKLIEVLFNENKFEESIKYCDMYTKKYNDNEVYIIKKKGSSYFKLKDYSKAIEIYEKLKGYKDEKPFAFFMLAEIYYNSENYQLAEKNYEYIVLNYPNSKYSKESLYWLTSLMYSDKRYKEALSYGKLFIKKYSKDKAYLEDVLFYIGNIYIENGDVSGAEAEFSKLLNVTNKEEVKINLIDILVRSYYKNGEYEKALKWLEKLKDSSFKSIWLGVIYEKQGNKEKALKEYQKVTKDVKNADKGFFYMGSFYLNNKQYNVARVYFNKVLDYRISEYKDKSIFKIGISFEEEGNYKAAITAFLRIKLVYSNSSLQDIATLKTAENYEKSGNLDRALKFYQEFYDNYKNSKYINVVVERLLINSLKNKDLKKAKKYYDELIKNMPQKKNEYKKFFETGGANK
ncbi:tetratricopeptide repeat protein [Haliovirga abyssi]|uniref:Ancillary SecYEG translocon subunit/Cell division coordinator CpoB TPR domain-containing protein n=1 Tax=Haliovirga abyssi TaxID=2996794 RepID=A0AAU9DBX7_9FUSO|nr:tetratricopeptide repeat protein [Haliovirga abyssi]BDU50976.1 hypothetical protein HLVA_15450 [Haliovirga abyssi]